ncbi:hypothetical protein MTsPCn9_03170 [Croceitalea sp. MTPC9]|uniref:hypothetical protein n=1 Tax=unclassified Croceitalea TaxID=2632280 RepID=UPI002B3F461B|nr:hypothetical protein MTsPCn6_05540 [Croceitalea sp. MTPC6]GMN15381.1 hypothetical protein MTsPCn9_03170 [Croceitalea sp. MTPC9]
MKKLLLLCILLFLSSCFLFQEKGIDYKVINNSSYTITNVKISTSEHLDSVTYDSIAPNESREGFLSMKNNKSDGSYMLSYTKADGNIVAEEAGYYTNGSALDDWIRFEVTNDTTRITFGKFPN